MAGTHDNTFVTELKLELSEFIHTAEICAKFNWTYKSLNYDLILGKDELYELVIILNFATKTITQQQVDISIKPPNYTAKDFFVIKKWRLIQNMTKRIKLNLDAE